MSGTDVTLRVDGEMVTELLFDGPRFFRTVRAAKSAAGSIAQ